MFYSDISKYYDDIFPADKNQLSFINKIKEIKKDENMIDIGCASGNLTKLLLEKTTNVIGIDLNANLIKIAKGKYPKGNFYEKNMLDINDYPKNHFDRIISFGNTLVHLENREQVKELFTKGYDILKKEGLLIFQIINYDRIVSNNIKSLPTIKNDKLTFVREYDLIKKGKKIEFRTKLTTRDGFKINSSVELLTLNKEEIENTLQKVGFKEIKFYGDLSCGDLLQDSIALLFSCKK